MSESDINGQLLKQIAVNLIDLTEQFKEFRSEINTKIDRIEQKLDAAYEQVAKNTENDTAFNELAATVADHDVDIKLLKRALAN